MSKHATITASEIRLKPGTIFFVVVPEQHLSLAQLTVLAHEIVMGDNIEVVTVHRMAMDQAEFKLS